MKKLFLRMRLILYASIIICVIASSATAYNATYTYDVTGRLTGATYDNGIEIAYTYDNAGNILNTTTILLDSDSDGMPDIWEIDKFGDLTTADSNSDFDNDNLLDKDEYTQGTDPKIPDTDGDGMTDGWEVTYGLDPLSDDSNGDLDGDGVVNLTDNCPGSPNPGQEDIDGDGIGNVCEGSVEVDFSALTNGDGSPGSPFNSLADAINAVDVGGTINIKGGSISGPFTFTKQMTIRSADGNTVIIGQ